MQTDGALGLLAVLAGGLTAGSPAATDQDTFNNPIAKIAPVSPLRLGSGSSPRRTCACPNDGNSDAAPGSVVSNGSVIVCRILSLDASGNLVAFGDCNNFAVLGTDPWPRRSAAARVGRQAVRGVVLSWGCRAPPENAHRLAVLLAISGAAAPATTAGLG